MSTLNQCIIAFFATNSIIILFVLSLGGCTPPQEPLCSHWIVPNDQKANAATHMSNLYRSGCVVRLAENISLRLFGSCPINCDYDPYFAQASQEIDAELVR